MEKINGLLNAIVEKETDDEARGDYVTCVETVVVSSKRYVEMVESMARSIEMARFTQEAEDYRETVMTLDRRRRIQHEALMGEVNVLNRVAARFGFDRVADVDENDRESYFSFAKSLATVAA